MTLKKRKMTEESAERLFKRFLAVSNFYFLDGMTPGSNSRPSEDMKTYMQIEKVFSFIKGEHDEVEFISEKLLRKIIPLTEEMKKEDFILKCFSTVRVNGREFCIEIYDDPDDVGWNSLCPDYDPETYLIINFLEYSGDRLKYEICAGFNIETMELLETFGIWHTNAVGIIREASDEMIHGIMEKYKGFKFFLNPSEKEIKDNCLMFEQS